MLVVDAGGAVGTAAIQLARGLDADVDAVCGPRGRGVCLELGAREAFDHTGSTRRLRNGGGYDAVLVAERVEGIASVAHALAFCHAVERAGHSSPR